MSAADCRGLQQDAAHWTTDCLESLESRIVYAVRNTPLPGCKGPCANDTSRTGCCGLTFASQKPRRQFTLLPAPGAPAPKKLRDPLLTYQNYINVMYTCWMEACNCPATLNPVTNAKTACGGVGKCVFSYDEKDDLRWSCSCDKGYTGAACEIDADPGTNVDNANCPKAWDSKSSSLVMCGGPKQGECQVLTQSCKCKNGWTGLACDTKACPTVNNRLCNGHGTCTFLGTCSCALGFGGPGCNCWPDPKNSSQTHCTPLDSDSSDDKPSAPSRIKVQSGSLDAKQRDFVTIVLAIGGILLFASVVVYRIYAVRSSPSHRHHPAVAPKQG